MTQAASNSQPSRSPTEMVSGFFRDTEINPRILGMLVALVAVLLGFHIWSDFTFLQPANMGTLAVQTSGTGLDNINLNLNPAGTGTLQVDGTNGATAACDAATAITLNFTKGLFTGCS